MSNTGENTLDAVWAVDSETSREFLLDRKTGKKLLERVKGKIMEVSPDDSKKV